jgi:hypothetical protein
MVKPIVFTAPANTNTCTKGKFAEISSNLARDCANDAGLIKGVFVTDKDSNNNVGIVDEGLMRIASAGATTYNFGATAYATSSGVSVTATSGTTKCGTIIEQKVVATTGDAVLVRLKFDN